MRRQLQIRDGVAQAEWSGLGAEPIPPSREWTFVDVTNRPDAKVGMRYDQALDQFTAKPPEPIPPDRLADIEAKLTKIATAVGA